MNTTLIKIDKEQAREKLRAYRASKHKDAEKLYAQAAAAYQAAADGWPLIDIGAAIREGGFHFDMAPKLAIARADRFEVRMEWGVGSTLIEFVGLASVQKGRAASPTLGSSTLRLLVDVEREHDKVNSAGNRLWLRRYARVPMVPADVRPKHGQLKEWHVLFEVEKWSLKSHMAPPPRDPYLLKHVGGDLYAVLAEWDLTELERAVMRQQVQA